MGPNEQTKTSPAELPLGFERLTASLDNTGRDISAFEPNPHYASYLRMHKVLLGRRGAEQLVEVHDSLRNESLPRYLSAAGWASVEAALILDDAPTNQRLQLLESGIECWSQAIDNQRELNHRGPEYMIDHAFPYRTALDIAVTPLLEGIINGNVTRELRQEAFEDCLNVAQMGMVQLELAAAENNVTAVSELSGFGYECNALLSFNRQLSSTWFAIPATVRSDSGHHHREQTHDLLVVEQQWGRINSMAPVEVKASANVRDRERFRALLVRGKMHLSVPGRHRPGEMLQAITAAYEGTASRHEAQVAEIVTGRFVDMVRDYYAGKRLGEVATQRSVTAFRDNSVVVSRHPGLALPAQRLLEPA